jgi:hypothetical protein
MLYLNAALKDPKPVALGPVIALACDRNPSGHAQEATSICIDRVARLSLIYVKQKRCQALRAERSCLARCLRLRRQVPASRFGAMFPRLVLPHATAASNRAFSGRFGWHCFCLEILCGKSGLQRMHCCKSSDYRSTRVPVPLAASGGMSGPRVFRPCRIGEAPRRDKSPGEQLQHVLLAPKPTRTGASNALHDSY